MIPEMASLAHHRTGTGPPVVLVHGLGSHRHVWDPVVPLLAGERELIALDLPGFGDSEPLPSGERPTVERLTDAVEAFLDELGLDQPHVAGNSLGGGIALELGRRGRVRSVTGLAPIGFATAAEARYSFTVLHATYRLTRVARPLLPLLARSKPVRTALFAQALGRPWRSPPEELLLSANRLADARGFQSTIEPITIEYAFHDPADLDGTPVTIAWGPRDAILLPTQARRAQAALPAARHVTLRGCGHVPMRDDPPAVAAVLREGSAG